MKRIPGWPLLMIVGVLIAVVAATVFKTPEIDNVIAWLFIGASLLMLGAWSALVIHYHDHDHRVPVEQEET